MPLNVLSAGAAQGIVKALAAQLGVELDAQFGAVGAIQEKLDAGTRCDLIILTRRQIDALQVQRRVRSAADLGQVRTGIAVRAGERPPGIATPDALGAALRAAREIHHPDAVASTAGAHFFKVLAELGIAAEVAPCLRGHPNGASAMRALASSRSASAIGCTQITEILCTEGIELIGSLPPPFGLSTLYAAGTCTDDPEVRRFLEHLTGPESSSLRVAAGFEI